MPEINILPKEVYQLIAAGEVVERPASIVKEMIENSIDAGAKKITVEIKNGGSTYIRITDDGCGIEKNQVERVFISHATSKIKNPQDLDSIATLGFRGEAMASIAAVARVELMTRAESEPNGIRYEIAGGETIDASEVGCPKGTTIVVRDIFFNTPARMKFLKKDVTEGNAVAGIIDRMAISHPEISFRFIRDGKQALVTSGNGDLKSAVYSTFGREFYDSLVDVDYTLGSMRVSGVVTKPHSSRKSRAMQYFFINSRLVKSKTVMAALEQAYRNSIMVGHFPGCVLNIECDTSFVDVNVHPAKIEVRFANEKPIFDLVYYGVKSAIEMGDTPKEASFVQRTNVQPREVLQTASGRLDFVQKSAEKPTQMEFKQKTDASAFWEIASPKNTYISEQKPSDDKPVYRTQPIVEEIITENTQEATEVNVIQEVEQQIDVPNFKVVGEAFKTYILVEAENELYIIDKHAAHERMNFERLKAESEVSSQMLLSPVAVHLSKDEHTVVCDNFEAFEKCGFSIEDFGNSTVLVRACPSLLNGEDVEDLVCEIAEKLLNGKTDIMPDKMDWIFHSTACRSAVKSGDYTSEQERRLFVEKLFSMPDIRYCPHGRPVMIKMSKREIEKQFGRIQ